MNIIPRKPESVNGSDYISNYPDMSKALKQCAKLKKQFLPYFTDGDLVGDCLLAKPIKESHICAYTLPDRAIMVVINTSAHPKVVDFDVDLAPWIKSVTGNFEVRQYDEDGKLVSTTLANAGWHGKSKNLEPNEMTVIEFQGK